MSVTLDLEREQGDPVMGIDEAGRGPLVGGVYAAAVSVPLALATAQMQPGVDLMTSASAKRFLSESFFESLMALHSFASNFSASASGTDTAAA